MQYSSAGGLRLTLRFSSNFGGQMAEEVGFEPTERLHAQQFSRLPHSTTLPLLRDRMLLFYSPRQIASPVMKLPALGLFMVNRVLRMQCASFCFHSPYMQLAMVNEVNVEKS